MHHPVNGFYTPQFEKVYETFFDLFASQGEIGASFCVWHKGKKVVDLWGGYQDRKGLKAWTPDTLTTLFSCTKGLTALCFLTLVDQGKLDYDTPIADFWPEFAQKGKEQITLRTFLNHRSGLVGIRDPLSLDELNDDERLARRLEQESPAWTPGEKQGYHATTFGIYAKIIFKKITGRSIGSFLHQEILPKCHTKKDRADVWIGLPKEHHHRVAPIFPNQLSDILLGIVPSLFRSSREGRFFRGALHPKGMGKLAFGQPAELGAKGLHNVNRPDVWEMELPWMNALGSARGLSLIYKTLIQPHTLVKPSTLELLKSPQSWTERDQVLRKPLGFSLGFIKEEPHLFSPSPSAFGHPGAGGALGYADPDHDLAFAYVMNRMGYHVRSPRALALCHALYASLKA